MSDFTKHLYAVMYPNRALIASQLDPEAFGKHYSVGTKRYYSGKMLFVEVDPEYRNDYFEIDKYLDLCVPHPDGTPKQTKFISSYRVLEHIDIEAIGALYAVTVSGETLKLEKTDYQSKHQGKDAIKIIQELNPLQLVVATTYDHRAFGQEMTAAGNTKGAPKLFFTQYKFDADKFLQRWQENPFMSPPFPGVHSQKLEVVVRALQEAEEPVFSSIGLQSVFDKVLYRNVGPGFFLAEGEKLLFYPLPSEEVLQRDHYSWWRATPDG